jgi:hypothetical protein
MKKLRAWFTVGSFAFLGSLAAVSCGSDEATGDGSGGGGTIPGGGSSGMDSGIREDTGTGATSGNIGRACATDAECGEGMLCISRTDTETLGGAPPKGLCTVACSTHDTCLEFSSDAWCVEYDNGGYCLEGCLMDQEPAVKCHDRLDFVCHVLDFAPLGTGCSDLDPCGTNEVCLSGECNLALTVCTPGCGSNEDCPSDLFCDYISGLCVETEPEGKDFNELCDPSTTADPNECVGGICSETYDDETEGTCSGFCNIGNPFSCGYTGEGKADAACLYGSILGGEISETGDLGICGQLCDCDDECTATGEVCRPFDSTPIEELWQRLGYCVPIVDGSDFTADESLGACEGGGGAPGAGGAGGTPAEAGASGTPAGGAGGAGGG